MTTSQTFAHLRRLPVNPDGSALVGGVIWIAAVVWLRPDPFDTAWAAALLLLAPLVLFPLGLRLAALPAATAGANRPWRIAVMLQLPAALLLGCAFLLPQGHAAAALTLPWFATTGLIGLAGLERVWHHQRGPLCELCIAAGLVYVAVGGFWAVCARWGLRPLDFEGVIVLLTAIHFHYAGFALPVLAGLAMRRVHGRISRLAGIGVIVGVPLVAAGITATQLNFGPWLECLSAWLLASAGFLTAYLYVRLTVQQSWPPLVRGLWALAALSLTGSMVLAAMYGSRFAVPIPWLDIPWMRALHGTANAFGFGLAALVGWTLAEHHAPTLPTSILTLSGSHTGSIH